MMMEFGSTINLMGAYKVTGVTEAILDDLTEKKPFLFEDVLQLCSLDKKFREEFISNPRQVLDKLGLDMAPGLNIRIVELPDDKTIVIGIYPLLDLSDSSEP